MVTELWHHYMSTGIAGKPSPVDQPWKFNVRTQIFCQNQEEYDYLSALNLMHGKDIEINIWGDWIDLRHKLQEKNLRYPKVLPDAYTTWYTNLRGF